MYENLAARGQGNPGKADNKEWFDELVSDLEEKREKNVSLPCRITDIKDKGLIVKVQGLYAFMPFNHAFWRYHDNKSWSAVFPKLINQKFCCQVYRITRKPLSIVVNGDIPQFKQAELIIGEEYSGIIISKTRSGVFIDIGCHFEWECGSVAGLLLKQFSGTAISFQNCKAGDEIVTTCIKTDYKGQMLFSNDLRKSDWYLDKPQNLVGQIVNVRITRSSANDEIEYLVKDKYKGSLNLRSERYPTNNRKKIRHILRILPVGTLINCEVTGFNNQNQTLDLLWVTELDIEFGSENSIQNNLDPDILEKLKLLLE